MADNGNCPTGACKLHGAQTQDNKQSIQKLEVRMEKLEINQRDPRIWIAVFGFAGVLFSTMGSIAGIMLVAWAKSAGYM